MQINVLGPLTAVVDGAIVTPTAPKPRQVLALLAACKNNVVRNEQIIEELWENQPPASVTTTLQTYVYQLRKFLQLNPCNAANSPRRGRHTADALRTFTGGYMLSLEPDQLDSLRFERLARLGRVQLESGAVAEAAHTLSSALDIWRGPALVDVNPGPILQIEVLRLEEIRKSTLERRIDADLQLGRHHELLSELMGLVANQPIHEGFWGKLMLALYRAGRRSEALQAYQQARNALVVELGVDPSGELQRLHHAILTGDPALDPPQLAPGVPTPEVIRLDSAPLSIAPPIAPPMAPPQATRPHVPSQAEFLLAMGGRAHDGVSRLTAATSPDAVAANQ